MMLLTLALIFLLGMLLGRIFDKLGLPKLLGMLLTGVLLGPYMLNVMDGSILGISTDLRKIALIIADAITAYEGIECISYFNTCLDEN